MQFVVLTDLIGTVVLPAAISLTVIMLVKTILQPPQQFADAIPLVMLAMVLLLPGFLILITTRKLIYVLYMFIYLLSLPVWNFLLPLYAFSKMDDFSWGETRKVLGDRKGDHADVVGESLASLVPLKKWEEWERFRSRKIKRDARRATDLSTGAPGVYGQQFYAADSEGNLRITDVPALPSVSSRFPSTIASSRKQTSASPFDSPISPPPPSHAFESPDEQVSSVASPRFVPDNRLPVASRLFDDTSTSITGNYSIASSMLLAPPTFGHGAPSGYASDSSFVDGSFTYDDDRAPLRQNASPLGRR